MFCNKCGKEIKEDSVFCNYCGNQINTANTKNVDIIHKKDSVDDETYKVCPSCGKLIKWKDKVCSYCGETYRKPQFTHIRGAISHPVISDKNFRTVTSKRPISIVLVVLLGVVFLMTLFILIAFNKTLLAIIIYFPIFIIITFSLIFVNLKIKRRSLGFLISTCAMIAIFIISSVGFSNIESKKNVAKVIPKNTNSTTTTLDSTTAVEIMVAAQKGSKENPWPTKDAIRVGEVVWQVLGVKDLGNILKDPSGLFSDRKTSGRFILIRFGIMNEGSDMKTLTDLYLMDNKGREYTSDSESFIYIENQEELFILDNINPGITKAYTTIYEVPSDAEGLMLEVTNLEFAGITAYIDLGL